MNTDLFYIREYELLKREREQIELLRRRRDVHEHTHVDVRYQVVKKRAEYLSKKYNAALAYGINLVVKHNENQY